MGVSVFPAPSTSTSVPGASNKPPKFTYNNSYDLSALTGLNAIDGTTTAMAYRRVDGCIYFMGSGNNNTYKFNTSTNTGSYVSANVSWSGIKDITCAYDGTLYASNSLASNASVETPQYSTDAGVNWTYLPSASAGAYRGFMGLVDDGVIPNVTGNCVTLFGGGSGVGSASDSSTCWINNLKSSTNTTIQSGSGVVTYAGGRAMFPLRDGDDVKTGSHYVWFGGNSYTGNVSYEVSRSGDRMAMRSALVGIRNSAPTSRTLSFHISPHGGTSLNASGQAMEPMFTIGKPTTIDSRWIVGTAADSTNSLQVIDYQTATVVNSVPIVSTTATNHISYGNYCANPIYVSATKKLYVLQSYSNGSANSTRMYVYDVTTY